MGTIFVWGMLIAILILQGFILNKIESNEDKIESNKVLIEEAIWQVQTNYGGLVTAFEIARNQVENKEDENKL